MEKMAQFAPLTSRRGMFAGSFSMGVTGIETEERIVEDDEDIAAGVDDVVAG